jgi:hypothetical protein
MGGTRARLAFRVGSMLIGGVSAWILAGMQTPARAAAEVQGDASDMRLSIENGSTREALQALSTSFGLRYSLPHTVGRTINGVYLGSLRDVVARVLDGNDYVLKFFDGNIEVVVIAASGVAAPASPPPAAAINNSVRPASIASNRPPPLASYLSGK